MPLILYHHNNKQKKHVFDYTWKRLSGAEKTIAVTCTRSPVFFRICIVTIYNELLRNSNVKLMKFKLLNPFILTNLKWQIDLLQFSN